MNIYSPSQIKDNKIRYEIRGKGTSARTFRTWDNQVLKVFLNNSVYKDILDKHEGDFLNYLIELSKLFNPSIHVTHDVYARKDGIVTAYKYPYIVGDPIINIKKSINLDLLIEAILELYANINLEENFRLRDMHGRNILYWIDKKTKKLKFKLIDLDLCAFTNKDERKMNIGKLDETIFKSVFYIPRELDPLITDERIKPLYQSLHGNEINIIGFLQEYRDFIIKEYGKCETVKHLNRGFIIPQCPNDYE